MLFPLLIFLIPSYGWASYGQSICGKKDFVCSFLVIFLYVGFFGGIPIACVLFALIHGLFSHPDRPRGKQVLLGISAGLLAFALSAFVASLTSVVIDGGPGAHNYLLWSFIATAVVCAAVSVYYVRFPPETFFAKWRRVRRS